MKKAPVIITFALLAFSCATKYGIETAVKPVPRGDIEIKKDGCAVIRSAYCDISAEEITPEKWKILLGNSIFTAADSGKTMRIPKLLFFHTIIRNTTDIPVVLDETVLKYSGRAVKPLDYARIRPFVKSPAYDIFNFRNILSPRRLLEDKTCLKGLRHDTETIGYEFAFIQPATAVAAITAFERPPIEARKMKLIFVFSVSGIKKIVDFDIERTEYRSTGDFQKTKEEKKKGDED